jgi:serine-type D-Ala-D-Ala carboxypeptidase/endopeptidase
LFLSPSGFVKTVLTHLVGGFVLGVLPLMAQSSTRSPLPTDAQIRDLLVQRIDMEHRSVGIVVGIIDSTGRRTISHGKFDAGDDRAVDGNTIFEIGSVTKVFTSLLLADMARRGEVALTDPAAKYLPAVVKMPERNGQQIALEDLATHTSGLPRLPSNLSPKDTANPYADYSVEQLYQFLSSYQLTRDIGSRYEYSNLGGALLGHLLARRAGMDYEKLVRSRICEPLGMRSTGITLSDDMKTRFAVGHDATMQRIAYWDLPTLAGAGALRSTATDLLNFVAANLDYVKTPLAPAMAQMLAVRRPTGVPGLEVGLAWHILTRDGHEIIWHNGGTGGFRSFIGFERKTGMGVVVLSNAETPEGVDDIGQHLLNADAPLWQPPKEHKPIAVDPKVFDGYVGQYQLAPNFTLTVSREGAQLFVQATGQPKVEIFPESDRDYFLKTVDAQITFETDAQGRATGLVLHQNGMNQPAKRLP